MPHTDVDEEGNNPSKNADYAHEDPAHHLGVHVRLEIKGENITDNFF